jgi:hypothetical protein
VGKTSRGSRTVVVWGPPPTSQSLWETNEYHPAAGGMSTNSVHVQNNILTQSSQPRRDALEASHAPRIVKLLCLLSWGVLRCGRPFWRLGAAFGCGRAPGGDSVPRTFRSMKEPLQRLMCPTRDTVWPIRSCSLPPKLTTKAWDTCTGEQRSPTSPTEEITHARCAPQHASSCPRVHRCP